MEFQAGAAPAVLSEPRVEILAPLQSLLSPLPGPPPTPGLAECSADRGAAGRARFQDVPFSHVGLAETDSFPISIGYIKTCHLENNALGRPRRNHCKNNVPLSDELSLGILTFSLNALISSGFSVYLGG